MPVQSSYSRILYMQVTTTKTAPQAGKTVRSAQEQSFDKAWQRVAYQQKENDRFREDVRAFSRDTRARIEDVEKACMDAMYGACLHLLSFAGRKSLTQWQRQTLMDWVTQYLQTMQENPFGSHLDMEPIRQGLADALAVMYPGLEHPSAYPEDDLAFDDFDAPLSDEEDAAFEDMFQELFAAFGEADQAGGPDQGREEPDAEQSFFHSFFQQQQAHEQQRHDESQALKRLMKSSSVNKLFRKVAGILHPDKEPDETARRDKNRLMGELIQARDTNDVPRLFAFYAEYVGQSPLQELGEDLGSVTQLLERQYLYLRDLKERILDEDPLTGVLYRRFHRKTPAATKRALNKHLKDTQLDTNALRALRQEVTSVNRLKPYLELHYDMRFQEEVFDFR